MKKVSIILTLALLAVATSAWAQTIENDVPYINESGQPATQNAIKLNCPAGEQSFSAGTTGETTWYVLYDDITTNKQLKCYGNVNLILCDGKTLTINIDGDAITCSNNTQTASLTIYRQAGGTGAISATSSYATGYGISTGNLTIHGGNLSFSGDIGIQATQSLVINGGTVNATGSYMGIAVNGTTTINGGTVNAECTGNYAATNFAMECLSGLTFNGGNLNATANNGATGINTGEAGNLTISYSDYEHDSFYASSYQIGVGGSFIVANDKYFIPQNEAWHIVCGSFSALDERANTLGGKTLIPYLPDTWTTGLGTEQSPYIITTAAQLNLLAAHVNGGISDYEGVYFKIGEVDNNTISYTHTTDWNSTSSTENNFMAIGKYRASSYNRLFKGHFDGNNKTISGIRIYQAGNITDHSGRGLFGAIGAGAVIKNLTLTDARITARDYVGGIVGHNLETSNRTTTGGTVTNCHVTNTVAIHAIALEQSQYNHNRYHGGIVGLNAGTVSGCTSAATLSMASGENTCLYYGGIAGQNQGTLLGNTVNEASITAYSYCGGIAGNNEENGSISGNIVDGASVTANTTYCGGITGSSIQSVTNNLVFNTTIAATNYYGAIAGFKNGTLENNYYLACTVNGTPNATNVGLGDNNTVADVTADDGALSLHTIISKPDDVTIVTSETVEYNSTKYWAQGKTVTLSGGLTGEPTEGWQKAYKINGVVISENSTTIKDNFNMPATDVTITIGEIHADWANEYNNPTAGSSSDNPYKIYFTDQLDLLATRVNNDNTNTGYAGKYFKLMNNLEYDNTVQNNYIAIGNYNHEFKGCFDGNYKTICGIRINLDGNNQQTDGYQGIFGSIRNGGSQVSPCEVKNLTIDDADITANTYAGGIVGFFYGGKVTNCHATSTVFVRSVSTGVQCHGGIVGTATAIVNAVEISHCTSSATLTNANNSGTGYGAIAGSITNGVSVSDNFAIEATVCSATNNTYGAIVGENYQNNSTLERNYYHNCTVAGEVNTITKGCENANVIASDGAIPVFSVSVPDGVTTSATATVTHNTVNYYKKDVPITLSGGLDGSNPNPGCQNAYVVYGETLIGSNLTPGHVFNMQNANAVVTIGSMIADWAAEEGAGDSEENPYKIYYIEQLDLLATRVNAGNYYSGKYFKLMNNLTYSYAGLEETESNYTPIGVAAVFKGHFDGNNDTISGIRIYLPNDSYRGLFGRINENAEVKNLTLTDAVITAKNQVGGIVGTMDGGTVTNCCVTSSVTIRAVVNQAEYHGGIVGEIYNSNSTISHCASSATLTIENSVSDCSAYGAIVGYIHANAVVRDNFAIGATVPATTKTNDYSHGAIAGEVGVNYTLERNYYYNCKVASASVTPTGVGRGSSNNTADITEEDGAMPVFTLSLASGISADVDTTLTHNEVNYYKLGTTVALSYTTQPAPGYRHIYSVNGTPIPNYGTSFNINSNSEVTVADQLIDWAENTGDDEENAYLIYNVEQWNLFADRVNGTNANPQTYSGKFFKLMEDISVTTMVGGGDGSSNVFSGTFDGDGHTITFNAENATGQYIAPFRRIDGATIKGVKLAGTVSSTNRFAGGIVAYTKGTSTVTNCVNSTNISTVNYNLTDSPSNGGIVGMVGGNGTINISGCVFNGQMHGTQNNNWCGILGLCNGGCTANISNCFFAPEAVTLGSGNHTIYRNNGVATTPTNCYYTQAMGTNQGDKVYTITPAEPVTVQLLGVAQGYDVSSITLYDDGGSGLKFDDVHYAASGSILSLKLGVEPGYSASAYCANGTELNEQGYYLDSYKLTMPEQNVTITATLENVFTKEILAHGTTTADGGWYLIASPIGAVAATAVTNLASEDNNNGFDLYRFDESADLEWQNWKQTANGDEGHYHFDLEPGRGYLYANAADVNLVFAGTPYSGNGEVTLQKTEGAELSGWNLVGNPFAATAYIDRPFYTMNETGSEIMAESTSGRIGIMQGVFVIANNDNEIMTFSKTAPTNNSQGNLNINMMQASSSRSSNSLIDRAIVSFNESNTLPKFQLFEGSTKIYIPQGNEDYAIVSTEKQGEMPLNFEASENGTYTISVNPEGVEMAYLHLIDNMTGADVDVLASPTYTFQAKTTDYASRFRLVFVARDASTSSESDETFAFYSNGSWIISNEGEATLQVIDINGHILSNESINGSVSTTINAVPGVYVIRVINGENVKVQKIVVR